MVEQRIASLEWEVKWVRVEMKFLVKNLEELTEMNKSVTALIERQNAFSERISKIENREMKEIRDMVRVNSEKLRKLEEWKIALVAWAWVIWAIASFILNKIF